ncbi:MAG TPA: ABC transporter permease [Candidatus Eisenbergiella pullicola]|nr:ABC transporter permease [Candidatus Eisenbergiella pullicola]
MRILDLLRMSSSSLWKRKFRTVLTVLGVVIGTASIVVMISLGLGLNRATMEQIEQSGGLTTIQVMEGYGGSSASGGAVSVMISGTSSSDDQVNRLDDSVVEMLKGLEHVESVVPILQVSAIGKYGPYEAYLNIQGMPAEGLKELNIQVGEGHLPTDSSELEFFYGNQVAADFYNPKTYEYPYYETGEYAVDFMKDTVFIIFDQQAYYASQNQNQNPGQDSGTSVQPPKKYIIPTAGVEKPNDENTWSSYGYRVLCDLDALKTTLKRVFRNKAIPGQPTTSSGKPYKDIYYSEVDVNVDDIDHVKEVQELIQSMGYQTYSNAEWVQSTQQQYANIQAMLGGIGAVSLLVAAIGITNTMMMSIYERTKEIGVMKVLGCDMRNIQAMFLIEAAYIGFIGGVVGLGLSYGISAIINKAVAASGNMTNLSYIPIWLAGAAVIFAVIIGMVAGFFPSRRAMKLSPLAAIRNE